ncbi:MAG: hypothetical protein IK028_01335 [Bacilli bacterium]|nr:hypothetical protein [Bacilli bacterium]
MKSNALAITLTVLYSGLWFCLLFLIVGFFMIKPVAFYNKIRGNYRYTSNKKSSSKYGYSDDPIEDEAKINDDMDED